MQNGTAVEWKVLNKDQTRQAQFNAIYEQDGAGLRRVAKLYGQINAQDLEQDIALAIWVALVNFRAESSLRTFAYRIAHNRGISQRQKRTLESLQHEPLDDSNPEDDALMTQKRDRLFSAMERLPIQTQQVVSMALEGLSYAEISDVIGITQTNVGVVIRRGKLRLNQLIGGQTDD